MQRHSGQTIAEYTMVAALIGVVAGGVLLMFATDFSASLPGLLDRIFGGDGDGASSSTSTVVSGSNGSNGSGSSGGTATASSTPPPGASVMPPMGAGEQQVCFDSGICLTVPVMTDATIDPVDTTGGMGSDQTHQMASVIQQLADQLDAAGADSALVRKISALANSGHDLGDVEGEIASLVGDCLDASMVCNENKTTYDAVATREGIIRDLVDNDFQGAWDDLKQYLDSNPQALLAFPEARAIIDQQAQEIRDVALSVPASIGTNSAVKHDGNIGTFGVDVAKLATITHQDANTICATGGSGCWAKRSNNGQWVRP